MNEWKNLDIGNLPPNILVEGAWEIEVRDFLHQWESISKIWKMSDTIGISKKATYRIRRPEGWESKRCPTCGAIAKRHTKLTKPNLRGGFTVSYCTDPWHDEPKTPTHEEILAPRFWKDDAGGWNTITGYCKGTYRFGYDRDCFYMRPEYFINRQSADIPSENS